MIADNTMDFNTLLIVLTSIHLLVTFMLAIILRKVYKQQNNVTSWPTNFES
jgi:heme/copper-type cytochrome/quinol oxidase subunit 2